ncbi:uncharacterized protein ARB_01855 [Trichophyton benhamiae CBS 112371]|uniref:Uncharacterized protein n=1 Tax=Arthroderma benhamiae (strain ATCC MYA-4681 / CBS 112371) TaxID=663331 RepID=D4B084_ARTBC|nr:uncharacterized protein ARB_01855 [Trichophyton benhamiae CBS 112371]EFE31236.1 hypothetical protein ARB_01855 [Trichophyton benhamiae CBS 112371]
MTNIISNILQTLYPYCSSLSGLISNMDWEKMVLVLATSWVTLRLLGIGLNFEQLFDLLGMDCISDRIRAVKGWFLLPESRVQLKWVEEMNKERAYYILRTQQFLAIKDLAIEHAIQRKLDVISKSWNTGPKDWKHKLLEIRYYEWIDRNQEFALPIQPSTSHSPIWLRNARQEAGAVQEHANAVCGPEACIPTRRFYTPTVRLDVGVVFGIGDSSISFNQMPGRFLTLWTLEIGNTLSKKSRGKLQCSEALSSSFLCS